MPSTSLLRSRVLISQVIQRQLRNFQCYAVAFSITWCGLSLSVPVFNKAPAGHHGKISNLMSLEILVL